MSRMRGVDDFEQLWERRTTLELQDGMICDLLSIQDLVKAKKTQRDKDWPMIRRLLEAHYASFGGEETPERLQFWFLEMRTPELLVALASRQASAVKEMLEARPLLRHAQSGDIEVLAKELAEEERIERQQDRDYWLPLKRELEAMRRGKE